MSDSDGDPMDLDSFTARYFSRPIGQDALFRMSDSSDGEPMDQDSFIARYFSRPSGHELQGAGQDVEAVAVDHMEESASAQAESEPLPALNTEGNPEDFQGKDKKK
jgi:hypothetical protein